MLGEEIKRKAIAKLEEFSPYAPSDEEAGPLLSGQDSLEEVKPIYEYVEENIISAANEILLVAPLDKLESERADQRVCLRTSQEWKKVTGTICTVSLPPDFLRLRSIRLGTWIESVEEAVHPNTPIAKAQKKEFAMGTFTKPVVVLDENKLYCYSVKPDAEICLKEFRYIPTFSEAGEYSDDIGELIALACAKKVYQIFQNNEGVSMMDSEMKTTMGVLAL